MHINMAHWTVCKWERRKREIIIYLEKPLNMTPAHSACALNADKDCKCNTNAMGKSISFLSQFRFQDALCRLASMDSSDFVIEQSFSPGDVRLGWGWGLAMVENIN